MISRASSWSRGESNRCIRDRRLLVGHPDRARPGEVAVALLDANVVIGFAAGGIVVDEIELEFFHGRLGLGSFVLTTEGTLKLCGVGEPDWLVSATDGEAESGDGTVASDLAALGRIARAWATATPEGARKGSKPKPQPERLQAIVNRLTLENIEEAYPSMAEVLADLERAGEDVPANAAAWERLVRAIRDQIGETNLRLSA